MESNCHFSEKDQCGNLVQTYDWSLWKIRHFMAREYIAKHRDVKTYFAIFWKCIPIVGRGVLQPKELSGQARLTRVLDGPDWLMPSALGFLVG